LTTKMHVKLWIPMILAALVAYGLYVYKKQTLASGKEDPKDLERRELVEKGQQVAVLFAAIVTVLGVIAYYGEKKLEYGAEFDPWTFWMGIPECRFSTPPVSISTSLAAAFGIRS
jgi:hypothetical protein